MHHQRRQDIRHTFLSHLEQLGNYVRLLFLDFSAAFITVLPHKLMPKLDGLGL